MVKVKWSAIRFCYHCGGETKLDFTRDTVSIIPNRKCMKCRRRIDKPVNAKGVVYLLEYNYCPVSGVRSEEKQRTVHR